MAKKKTQKKLYLKGKPLTKFKEDYVKKVAEVSNVKVNTPARLKKFFEKNKNEFEKKFSFGVKTIPKSSTKVFDSIDTADRYGKKFYINKKGKKKEVSANELKFELSKVELQLNNIFDSTGAEFSYKLDFENNIEIDIPEITEDDEEFYQSESMEIVVDHFSEDYGINIYVSEPKNKDQQELHKQYKEEYATKIKSRIKKYKPRAKPSKSKSKPGRKNPRKG